LTRTVVSRASAIVVGSELLSGKVAEANVHALAKMLRALGIRLEEVLVLPDDTERVAAAVRAHSDAHDVVFTSGGVGPTHDDVTLEAVGLAFGVPVHRDPELVRLLTSAYPDRLEQASRMALVPMGAVLHSTEDIRWPTVVMRNVWVLPGVPEIFRMKLDVVRRFLVGPRPIFSREVYTRLDEVDVKDLLDAVVRQHPSVEVGSYPKWFDPSYKTKVTLDSADEAALEAACEALLAGLPAGEPQRVG
jgi:molybdenum cofactor synthesis domain-containing protein